MEYARCIQKAQAECIQEKLGITLGPTDGNKKPARGGLGGGVWEGYRATMGG